MNDANVILKRAAAIGHPPAIINGGAISGEYGWRQAASYAPNLGNLALQLDALEAEHARRVECDALEDQRARDREDVRTEDPEMVEENRRAAAEELQRHVAEGPARMERFLERIANAVEALAKR